MSGKNGDDDFTGSGSDGAACQAGAAIEIPEVGPPLGDAAAADRVTGLLRLWRGELPLADAFWNWAVVGGLLVNGITTFLFLILIWADRPIEAVIVGYVCSVPYNIVAAVGVWRSADTYAGDHRWAALARIVTVIGMVLLSVT